MLHSSGFKQKVVSDEIFSRLSAFFQIIVLFCSNIKIYTEKKLEIILQLFSEDLRGFYTLIKHSAGCNFTRGKLKFFTIWRMQLLIIVRLRLFTLGIRLQLFTLGRLQLFTLVRLQLFTLGRLQLFTLVRFDFLRLVDYNCLHSVGCNFLRSEGFKLSTLLRCKQTFATFYPTEFATFHIREVATLHMEG